MSVPSAADLHRLADEANRRGLQLFVVEATGEYYVNSSRAYDRLHRVTLLSCDCQGFIRWGKCTHHSLLLLEKNALPPLDDDDPDPADPGAILTPIASPRAEVTSPAQVILLRPSATTTPTPVITPVTEIQEPPPAPDSFMSPVTLTDPQERAQTMQSVIDDAIERLATQLAAGHSDAFRSYLTFASRFWSYSPNNVLLILAQLPTASRVAGLRKWAELGYQVRKGERAIWIWCPVTRIVEDPDTGEKVERLIAFRPGAVFDVSQLANLAEKPLPTPFAPLPDDAQQLYRLIRDRVVRHGIAIEERRLAHGVEGISQGGRIVVNSALDSRRRIFTLVHELVHELAHRGPESDGISIELKELEAEGASFAIATVIGLEHVYARDYVLSWGGTPAQLKTSLGRIQRVVRQVLTIITPAETAEQQAA